MHVPPVTTGIAELFLSWKNRAQRSVAFGISTALPAVVAQCMIHNMPEMHTRRANKDAYRIKECNRIESMDAIDERLVVTDTAQTNRSNVSLMLQAGQVYRKLLKAIRSSIDLPYRSDYVDFVRGQFRHQTQDRRGMLQLGEETADHLIEVGNHRAVLTRYNITTNRDAAQLDHVKSVARRVGLVVPDTKK